MPVELIHKPWGDHHPYEIRPYQRHPVLPFPDDQVEIGILTRPIGSVKELKIQFWLDDRPDQVREASFELLGKLDPEEAVIDDGHLSEAAARAGLITDVDCWKTCLPPYSGGSLVSYQISCISGKERIETKVFSYKVRKHVDLQRISRIYHAEKKLVIEFENPDDGQYCYLLILLKDTGHYKLNMHFSQFNDQQNAELEQVELTGDTDRFEFYDLVVETGLNAYQITFNLSHDRKLKLEKPVWLMEGTAGQVEQVGLIFNSSPDEGFFGLGERYNSLNQRGNCLDTRVFEQYKNQGKRTYLPVPLLISSRGYGLFTDNSRNTIFDLGKSDPNQWQINSEVNGNTPLKIDILLGDSHQPLKLVSQLNSLTGRPVAPPSWAFGLWISSNEWNTQASVDEVLKSHQELGIPFSVLVLEAWSDENTFYIWNDARYQPLPGEDSFSYDDFEFPDDGMWPDPKGLIESLHENDQHLLLWQIPVMKDNTEKHQQLENDTQTMLEKGCYVRQKTGEPYQIRPFWFQDGLLMDFTHTKGKEWWFEKRRYLLQDLAIDGFKTDGGEHIWGKDLIFADGRTSSEIWNEYPNLYVGSYFEYSRKHKPDAITFSRAGFSGAQAYPCHWAGDEASTWDAFRASILAGINAGISGIPFWGWDIAGFSGETPTAELYLRSTAMAVFCPIMQYHSEFNDHKKPINDRTPWNIAARTGSPEVIELFKHFTNLRMNLMPYIINTAKQASTSGIPMMRALRFVYPENINTAKNPYQYMFGDHLLITPVVEPDQAEIEIFLPDGEWYSLWDDKFYTGGNFSKVPSPLDQIPVFVTAEAVLALNLDKSYQLGSDVGNRTDSFQNLCFKIYPHSQGNFSWIDENTGNSIALKWTAVANGIIDLEVLDLSFSPTLILPSNFSFETSNTRILPLTAGKVGKLRIIHHY